MNEDEVIQRLKKARRELDCLYPEVKMIDDWQYDSINKKWYYHLSISVDNENTYFPNTSLWYAVVDPSYPQGYIKIYPDINQSITTTLYHQSNNYRINKNDLWREGALCVDVNTLSSCNPEPFTVEKRLLYHVSRAVEWLKSAANNRLVSSAELFELPEFNNNILTGLYFAFSEDTFTYQQWEDTESRSGIVDIDCYKSNPKIFYTKTFYSLDNKPVHYTRWGYALENQKSEIISKAPWVLLKGVPVMYDWQVPETWGELVDVCKSQGYDIITILKNSSRYLRDGHRHIFLLGFPIPKYWFQDYEVVYWKAFLLPTLSFGQQRRNGFRNNQEGYWNRDIMEILKPDLTIDWVISENWNQEEISQRGKMSQKMKRKSILLLGSGCLGASIAEILVRSGIYNLSIADADVFRIGNLSRHTLTLSSIGNSKCSSLCTHLNFINPHAEINAIKNDLSFTLDNKTENIDIDKYDIIIDCTGENDVLEALSNAKFKRSHYFISVSIGFGAKRLYINMQNNIILNFDEFFQLISPFINAELQGIDENKLPRDGIGCWHPTFPARSDDIWMAASIAVKVIEKYINEEQSKQLSLVYEQKESDYYEGYTLIDRCECD